MPEENAFWLLVASMQRPRAPLRELFLPGMVKVSRMLRRILSGPTALPLLPRRIARASTSPYQICNWLLAALVGRAGLYDVLVVLLRNADVEYE